MRTRATFCSLLAIVLAGGAPVVAASWRLNGDERRQVSNFFFGPAGGVTFIANPPRPGLHPFWKAPLEGGANTLITEGPREGLRFVGPYYLTPDEQHLVVRHYDHPDNGDLWSIRLADGTAKRLTFDNKASGAFSDPQFWITPDSQRAVYISRTIPGEQSQLYSVPVDGSALPTQLSSILDRGTNTVDVTLTPDGTTVLYRANQLVANRFDLFRTSPAGGGSTPVNATPGFVTAYKLGLDDDLVVYRVTAGGPVDRGRLYATSLSKGIETPLASNLPAAANVSTRFELTSDQSHVVFEADPNVALRDELLAAPVAGGPTVPVSGFPAGAGQIAHWVLPSAASGPNALVGFSTYDLNGQSRFYVNSLDGGEPRLLGTLGTPGGNFRSHHLRMSDSGDLLFAFVDASITEVVYAFPTDGSGGFEYFGPMDEYLLHPDGKHIVYAREQGNGNTSHHLYWEPLDRSAPPLRISDEDGYPNIGRLEWSPDSRHVVYMRRSSPTLSDLYVAMVPVPEPTTPWLLAFAAAFVAARRSER